MTQPAWAVIGIIVIGALLVPFAPKLARRRLFLPPPTSRLGQTALIVGIEALGCLFIVGGIDELLGASNVHNALDLLAMLSLLVIAAAFLVVFATGVADILNRLRRTQHKPSNGVDDSAPG
jgi:hypothetical protein